MLEDVRSGRYQALVLDAPFIRDTASHDGGGCSLYSVGESFMSFNQAIAFPADFDDTALQAWSRCGTAAHQPDGCTARRNRDRSNPSLLPSVALIILCVPTYMQRNTEGAARRSAAGRS
jgi:hypothetical protein